jgi:hypothetical protein
LLEAGLGEEHPLGKRPELSFCSSAQFRLTQDGSDECRGMPGLAQRGDDSNNISG